MADINSSLGTVNFWSAATRVFDVMKLMARAVSVDATKYTTTAYALVDTSQIPHSLSLPGSTSSRTSQRVRGLDSIGLECLQ